MGPWESRAGRGVRRVRPHLPRLVYVAFLVPRSSRLQFPAGGLLLGRLCLHRPLHLEPFHLLRSSWHSSSFCSPPRGCRVLWRTPDMLPCATRKRSPGLCRPRPPPFTPTMRRVRPGPREEGTASPSAASRGRSVARQGGRLRRSVQTAGRRAKGCGGQRDRSPYLLPSRLAPRPTLCLVHMNENLEKWRGRVKAAGVVASGAADGDPALRLSRPQDCPVPAGRSLLLVCGCGRQGSAWQPAAWAARGL